MKKTGLLVMICVGLLLTGCGNGFAQREYDSDTCIAEQEDRYAKVGSVFNPIEGGYSLEVSEFDGRQTLWSGKLSEEKEITLDISLKMSEGKVKIVHIDDENTVTTILECTPDTVPEKATEVAVLMKKGQNRIKIVGYDCRDIDLEILSDVFE